MKRIWLYTIILIFLSACQGIKTVNSAMEDAQLGYENEKATAIFWVDRNSDEKLTKYGAISTVKVHVNVYSDGTFRILSFCKQQEPEVVRYLEKRAAVFTIPQRYFTKGFIKPGEQYMQLRYIPTKVWSPNYKGETNKKVFQY